MTQKMTVSHVMSHHESLKLLGSQNTVWDRQPGFPQLGVSGVVHNSSGLVALTFTLVLFHTPETNVYDFEHIVSSLYISKYVLIFLLRDNKPTMSITYNTAHFSMQCGWYVLLPFFIYRDMNIRYKDVKFKFFTS